MNTWILLDFKILWYWKPLIIWNTRFLYRRNWHDLLDLKVIMASFVKSLTETSKMSRRIVVKTGMVGFFSESVWSSDKADVLTWQYAERLLVVNCDYNAMTFRNRLSPWIMCHTVKQWRRQNLEIIDLQSVT